MKELELEKGSSAVNKAKSLALVSKKLIDQQLPEAL